MITIKSKVIPCLIGIPLFMVAGACRHQGLGIDKSQMPTADSPYVKVFVTKSGEIMVDGKPATINELEGSLAALAQKHGVVLYGRDAPDEKDPHPMVKNVLNIVIKNRLPIRLCTRNDCSDVLTAAGKLRMN